MNGMDRGRSCVRLITWCAGLAGLSMAMLPALSCGYEHYPSVHFNSREPDFGAPPRAFSISSWREFDDRPLGCPPQNPAYSEEEGKREMQREAIGQAALANATRLESAGRFEASIPRYRHALAHGTGDSAALKDREELFAELTPGLDRTLLARYLAARRDYESSQADRGEARMKSLAGNPQAGILRAHAQYVLGGLAYDDGRFIEAAAIFEVLAHAYPHSRRREAALIMVPRSLLHSSVPDGTIQSWVGKSLPGGSALQRSRAALQTLLHDYPQTRFRPAALAWLARAGYLEGRRVAALKTYLRQYATFSSAADRESAAASIRFVTERLSRKEAGELRNDLQRHGEVLGDYLAFRLEHGDDPDNDLPGLAALTAHAPDPVRRTWPARVLARLAELAYLRGRYCDAVAWATRALVRDAGAGSDLARYVRSAACRRLGRYREAEAGFTRLLRRNPQSYLCGAARENLALLYERQGRLGLALDQYLALGYREDMAYALDVRMTTGQVASYLRSHPACRERDLLVYSLGIRQLRDNQLTQALATLSRLPDKTVRQSMGDKHDDYFWWPSIYNRVRDPRRTARDLAGLERAITVAKSPETRAAAMYAKASYLYRHRDLLFYNAALWRGGRNVDFGFFWNTDIATPGDVEAVRAHHFSHECLYRARALCLVIARRYPGTAVAPKALYRAACASDYLADFNGWWRKEAGRQRLEDSAVQLMTRVYRQYPRDPLAKPARKFAKVFAGERAQAGLTALFTASR